MIRNILGYTMFKNYNKAYTMYQNKKAILVAALGGSELTEHHPLPLWAVTTKTLKAAQNMRKMRKKQKL